MLIHTLRRFRRSPLPALAVLLFALILSAVLCGLHRANIEEQKSFEQTYHTIPVHVKVTNLSATKDSDLEMGSWFIDVFTGETQWVQPSFQGYVKDVHVRMDLRTDDQHLLAGITGIPAAAPLQEARSGQITWFGDYDESVFSSEEKVCLVPRKDAEQYRVQNDLTEQQLLAMETPWMLAVSSSYNPDPMGWNEPNTCSEELTVVGYYTSRAGEEWYFIPMSVMKDMYTQLGKANEGSAVSATLVDNTKIEEFQKIARAWFAEPNPTGAKTEWNSMGSKYYLYALDIDDSKLETAARTLKNSLAVNELCALLVFVLSAGTGFFIGFLMIRQRKREIALMRTMGTPTWSVYCGFLLEQMLCVLTGTALGGLAFGWEPGQQLGQFVLIYFIGLNAALLMFLRKNLLTTIKEDE